jgi:hypothetical protein
MNHVVQQAAGPQLRRITPLEQQKHIDLDWALANYNELEARYPGEHVLIWKQQVVAHGTDLDELLNQADAPEHPRTELAVFTVPAFLEIPH